MPSRADRLKKTLKQVFGFDQLRPGQNAVIASVIASRHTLAVMPTGAGKSLCYQLPALLLPGVTVVVSPLIALMKDQYDKLQELGIATTQINSAVPSAEKASHHERIAAGDTEFVFTTPEQLSNSEFVGELKRSRIDLLVIDEAHCISQWGHDFRPAYLGLRDAARALGAPPILALTATATERVVDDIRVQLGLDSLNVIQTGVYRPNLKLAVGPVDDEEEKQREAVDVLTTHGGPAIVYTATVAHAESLPAVLHATGKRIARYHGRVPARERHEIQDAFMGGDLDAIVATNAFGMGVDKADIRLVLHYDMPGSLDAYYQEAGRAGRDGEPADCVMLFRRQDRSVHNFLMSGRYPTLDGFISVYQALETAADPLSLAEVQKRANAVAGTKARVILSSLKEAGIVTERRGSRFTLKQRPPLDEIATIARAYIDRAQDDREKLDRMVAYGQTALCRWGVILGYFGESDPLQQCGHCDNCTGTAKPSTSPLVASGSA